MSECPFCVAPRDPRQPVLDANDTCYLLGYQDESLLGMMVIPFRHVETPFDLTSEEWAALQPLVLKAQNLLADHNPDGFNLGWNVGVVGGQEVFHVHLHVFARFADEPYAGSGIRRWFKSEKNRRP